MINTPHIAGQNWDQLIQQARKDIVKKISAALNIDLESLIVSEMILDPRDIESQTSSYLGSLYGSSSN
ncbi:MAG: phytoene desaturase, partial [Chitinophagales bacterium]|nr:phytoene desaturase [Chitinophagales bacterium]